MVAVRTEFKFPCFLLVSRVWNISSGIGPCLQLAGGLYCTPTPEENDKYIANQLTIQAASQSTFINPQLYSTSD